MDAVVCLRQFPLRRPPDQLLLLRFEPLKRLYYVNLELGDYPHCKLEGDVFVRIGAAVKPRLGNNADGVCSLCEFLHADFEGIEAGLISNCGDCAIIKRRIVHLLPDADILKRVAIAEPISDKEFAILRL